MPQGTAPDVRLRDLVHLDRGHDPALRTDLLKAVLQGQAIEDRGDHAHVVGGGALHTLAAGGQSPEDVAAADHDGDLGL